MFHTLLVNPIFNLLAAIYAYVPGHDFGLAIIILTILVRLALWPVIAKQLHSQRAMQKLAPELAKVKEQAAGDKQKENQMLMDLYRDRGINPLASLLPVLIQIPLFLALFVVLRAIIKPGEIAKLAYSFIQKLPAIQAIIHASAFHPTLFNVVDLSKPSPVLAVFAGIAQYIQTKQIMPKPTPGDAQASAMSAMTIIFPFLTVFIGLSLPSALSLYWTVASIVAVGQQAWFLHLDVQELEDMVEHLPAKATTKSYKSKKS